VRRYEGKEEYDKQVVIDSSQHHQYPFGAQTSFRPLSRPALFPRFTLTAVARSPLASSADRQSQRERHTTFSLLSLSSRPNLDEYDDDLPSATPSSLVPFVLQEELDIFSEQQRCVGYRPFGRGVVRIQKAPEDPESSLTRWRPRSGRSGGAKGQEAVKCVMTSKEKKYERESFVLVDHVPSCGKPQPVAIVQARSDAVISARTAEPSPVGGNLM
jgi:hypothetical protein